MSDPTGSRGERGTNCIAAFDFDGTLARGDSLIPFLLRLIGGHRVARAVLAHAPALGLIGIGKGDRDRTKERFIARLLTGHPAEEIHSLGKDFAGQLIADRLFHSALERVEWHKSQGHRLLLISAALDVYLEPLAEQLGFERALTTRLEIVDGRATGRLIGANVRAAQKVHALHRFLGDQDDAELWAYGNSAGDYELLEIADHPHWVSKRGDISPWGGRGAR